MVMFMAILYGYVYSVLFGYSLWLWLFCMTVAIMYGYSYYVLLLAVLYGHCHDILCIWWYCNLGVPTILRGVVLFAEHLVILIYLWV